MTTVADHPAPTVDPPYDPPEYRSTRRRAPSEPLVLLAPEVLDVAGPVFGERAVRAEDADLTRRHDGEPLIGRDQTARLMRSAGMVGITRQTQGVHHPSRP